MGKPVEKQGRKALESKVLHTMTVRLQNKFALFILQFFYDLNAIRERQNIVLNCEKCHSESQVENTVWMASRMIGKCKFMVSQQHILCAHIF